MKTYSAKPTDVTRQWYLIDASTLPLGRLSTQIANILTGKTKPQYTPHIDCGDYVIVINSDALKVTGNKKANKIYYRHTGFPGGIKQTSLDELLKSDSTSVIKKSVRGMISDNKLRDSRLARLKVYKDANHNHSAQKPITITLKETS